MRREHVSNNTVIERFKREINLARQVTHPNVCRIYEFGHERRGRDLVFFLTMELLEGETLHERIGRQGPLSTNRGATAGAPNGCRSLARLSEWVSCIETSRVGM